MIFYIGEVTEGNKGGILFGNKTDLILSRNSRGCLVGLLKAFLNGQTPLAITRLVLLHAFDSSGVRNTKVLSSRTNLTSSNVVAVGLLEIGSDLVSSRVRTSLVCVSLMNLIYTKKPPVRGGGSGTVSELDFDVIVFERLHTHVSQLANEDDGLIFFVCRFFDDRVGRCNIENRRYPFAQDRGCHGRCWATFLGKYQTWVHVCGWTTNRKYYPGLVPLREWSFEGTWNG